VLRQSFSLVPLKSTLFTQNNILLPVMTHSDIWIVWGTARLKLWLSPLFELETRREFFLSPCLRFLSENDNGNPIKNCFVYTKPGWKTAKKGKWIRFLKVILSGVLCPFFISPLWIINPLLSLSTTKNIAKSYQIPPQISSPVHQKGKSVFLLIF
jgi:hypothetical protein